MEEELRPYTKKIDSGDFYAEKFLKKLGELGMFASSQKSHKDILYDGMILIEETAKTCMTTAFCLWCHYAALTYLRHTNNEKLKKKLLPSLENGEILGGTGLSNPMKYYAGLEKLHLSANQVEGGYILSGVLPAVSNLGENHWFGAIASVNENKQVMCFIPCNAEGLTLKEKVEYLGVNGSATYSCSFQSLFVPNEWVISDNAFEFVEQIKPTFIFYQIPLGLGVIQSSIESIDKVCQRQNGCNGYLRTQSSDLKFVEQEIKEKVDQLFNGEKLNFKDIAKVRLDTAYLTLDVVQTSMLHHGSSGYLRDSAPSRRLREAYFFANLTPTVKHLEKVLHL
jgi:alkylation response protein AidB-like acyl-CoA dehydrogenase